MMDDRTATRRRHAARVGRQSARYESDLYGWAIEQAALLRAGRLADADACNIAEELDDVGNEQYDKMESALRILLVHLLKWDHQPRRRSRSWWASISVQRNQLRRVLTKDPGLRSRLQEAIGAAYEDARFQAAAQTQLNPRTFVARCPYSWAEIMDRQISWPAED